MPPQYRVRAQVSLPPLSHPNSRAMSFLSSFRADPPRSLLRDRQLTTAGWKEIAGDTSPAGRAVFTNLKRGTTWYNVSTTSLSPLLRPPPFIDRRIDFHRSTSTISPSLAGSLEPSCRRRSTRGRSGSPHPLDATFVLHRSLSSFFACTEAGAR